MAGSHFGTLFKIVTFGESHGRAMGVVIDGCPAGLELSEEVIGIDLERRRPGHAPHTSPRKEEDRVEILSGVFEGKTTGAPIALIIENRDVRSEEYVHLKDVLRPGHANFTYLEKYGHVDWRGGGRASARETVARVAAGAVAKQLLRYFKIEVMAHLESPTLEEIAKVQEEGDSIGGVVALTTTPLPIGLGEPVFERLEANLAKAMLSIPASKGVEFGAGFAAASMRGSECNDRFARDGEKIVTETNHSGGTLGGISNGMPLKMRVAFKPTSSIRKEQETLNSKGERVAMRLVEGARHDPCVAVRGVVVVEAMAALVLADHVLIHLPCDWMRAMRRSGASAASTPFSTHVLPT